MNLDFKIFNYITLPQTLERYQVKFDAGNWNSSISRIHWTNIYDLHIPNIILDVIMIRLCGGCYGKCLWEDEVKKLIFLPNKQNGSVVQKKKTWAKVQICTGTNTSLQRYFLKALSVFHIGRCRERPVPQVILRKERI